MRNHGRNTKLVKVNAAAVSAGTAINTDSVDMSGWGGVEFFGTMATSNAANFVNLAQSADDSSFADLEGTKVVPSADANTFRVEVVRPTDRYVRLEVDRGGANTAVGDIFALLYNPNKAPITQASDVDYELHVTPAEGTA